MYKILANDQKQYGPVDAGQLRQWIREGRANAQTMVFVEGGTEWKALGTLPEFSMDLLATAASAAAARSFTPLPIRKFNGLALTGFILGLISVTCGLCCYGVPFNILGIIFSLCGLMQIKANPEKYSGKGLAIAGLVISILSLVLGALVFIATLSSMGQDVLNELKKL